MSKQMLVVAILAFPFTAHAECVPNAPEIGDIGPDSTSVCRTLQRLYPGTALVEQGRAIRSATEVVVDVLVDGRPIALGYVLSGYTWQLQGHDGRLAENTGVANAPRPE